MKKHMSDNFDYDKYDDKAEAAIIALVNGKFKKENEFQRLVEENGYKVRAGQWRWVRFNDGCCVFDPHLVINGKKVVPLEIRMENSCKMINEYIARGNKGINSFTWAIDKNNKAVVDDTFIPSANKIIKNFIQAEYNEFKKDYGDSFLKLNWMKDIKKDFVTYTIQPDLECPMIKPIQIAGDMFSPSVDELIRYRSQLPVVQYKISKNFNVSQFDFDKFQEALEKCKKILVKKYGEQWERRRIEKYESKTKTVATSQDNAQEVGSLGVADKLRHKITDKSIFDVEFELQWEDIKFYDGYYVFEPNLESRAKRLVVEPLRKESFRCRRSFMSILNHFKNQMPKITYRITKDFKIRINKDPDFEDALIFLAKEDKRKREADEFEHTAQKQRKLSFAAAMAKADKLTVEELIKNKTEYFNFLIAHQVSGRRVVPVTENVVHFGSRHDEDSFMFTLKSYDGQLFIVVENVNVDRASMIFKTSAERYDEALYAVFEYVQSDRINKRSAVRGRHIDFKNSGVVKCKSIDHDSPDEWKRRMRQYFR